MSLPCFFSSLLVGWFQKENLLFYSIDNSLPTRKMSILRRVLYWKGRCLLTWIRREKLIISFIYMVTRRRRRWGEPMNNHQLPSISKEVVNCSAENQQDVNIKHMSPDVLILIGTYWNFGVWICRKWWTDFVLVTLVKFSLILLHARSLDHIPSKILL